MTNALSRRYFLRQTAVSTLAASTLRWDFADTAPVVAAAVGDATRTFSGEVTLPEGFRVPAGEVYAFDPDVTTTVTVSRNVVVYGTLRMRPANAGVVHTLRFVDVDESRFLGGGMNILSTDTGLWVRGDGLLDLRGTPKKAWTTTGWDDSWRSSDEVRITPTARGDFGRDGFLRYRQGDRVPSVSAPTGVPTSFSDTSGHVFHDDIEAIVAAGIANGGSDGRFRPDAPATRAEVAVMIAKAFDLPSAPSSRFPDVRGHWARHAIDRVAAARIVLGYPNGRFGPNDRVTRSQFAAMAARAMRLGHAPRQGFTDTRGHWAERVIDRVAAAGIMGQTGNGRFYPENRLTRGQLSAVLRRALDLPTPGGTTSPHGRSVFAAEVLNLTRNVLITGTATGRAHINIHSTVPQTLTDVELRHLGPRTRTGEGGVTAGVLGRYALHFHHCQDGSRGSIVDRVVVSEAGGHAFVAHDSHGVTFRHCIAYDVLDEPFWWDKEPGTNDTVFDRCVAAHVKVEPYFRGYTLSGFVMGKGSGNVVTGCVAVGVQGNKRSSGFTWPSAVRDSWEFTDCLAHNNEVNGIFTWQNNGRDHDIRSFTAYRNGKFGIEHGAYRNSYVYDRTLLMDNGEGSILLHAVSRHDGAIKIRNSVLEGPNGIHTTTHNRPPGQPTQIENVTFLNHRGRAIVIDNQGTQPDLLTLRGCDGVRQQDIVVRSNHPGSRIRMS